MHFVAVHEMSASVSASINSPCVAPRRRRAPSRVCPTAWHPHHAMPLQTPFLNAPQPAIAASPLHVPRIPGCRRLVAMHGWSRAGALAPVASAPKDEAPLDVTVRMACGSAELRAAAYLRAASFYSYPPGRSEWAERSHRRMKADTEWESVSAKVEGRDTTYAHLRVTAFIATIPDEPDNLASQQVAAEMDLSSKLPAEGPDLGPAMVVATLDLNQGRSLPAEELQGKWPQAEASDPSQQGDPNTQRAYLSNVCVSKAVRRRGVARHLIEQVEAYAARAGVTHMYVHVVADNGPAVQLYTQALGYQIETEESGAFARSAGRPRRLILCKRLRG